MGTIVQKAQDSGGGNSKPSHKAKYADPRDGRRSQIRYKCNHGIRNISPVLMDVEREGDWQTHLQGIYQSLSPGSEYEANLVYLIAWALWRLGRLVRHETALTTQMIHEPPAHSLFASDRETITKEAIRTVLEQGVRNGDACPTSRGRNGEVSANGFLSRCRELLAGTSDVMFDPAEVREILGRIVATVEEAQKDEEKAAVDSEDDEEEIRVEERQWSAQEVAEQIRILSETCGVDPRRCLESLVQALQDEHETQADEQTQEHEIARAHVVRNLILGEQDVARLSAYERQILASLKTYYNLLERERARRLGTPLPPPVSVDLNITRDS
jgi:hypothetical protein